MFRAFLLHIWLIQSMYLHILCIFFTYNCKFFAYLRIFLPDPFQLALCWLFLYHSSKPYNNSFMSTLYCSQAHADSHGYGDPGAPPWPVNRPAPPARRPARPSAAAAPSASASAASLLLLLQDKVAKYVIHAKYALYADIWTICTIYVICNIWTKCNI